MLEPSPIGALLAFVLLVGLCWCVGHLLSDERPGWQPLNPAARALTAESLVLVSFPPSSW